MINIISVTPITNTNKQYADITYYDDENILNSELYYTIRYGPITKRNNTISDLQAYEQKFIQYVDETHITKTNIEHDLDIINKKLIPKRQKSKTTKSSKNTLDKSSLAYFNKRASTYLRKACKNGYTPVLTKNVDELYNISCSILKQLNESTMILKHIYKKHEINNDEDIKYAIYKHIKKYVEIYIRQYRKIQRDVIIEKLDTNDIAIDINEETVNTNLNQQIKVKYPAIKGTGNYRYTHVDELTKTNIRVPLKT